MDRQAAQSLNFTTSPARDVSRAATSTSTKKIALRPFLTTFAIMAGVWVMIAGKYDLFHSTLGLISCTLVAYMSSDLLFPSGVSGLIPQWIRFARYIPWLIKEIVKSGIHVTYLVFHPRMMDLIDPRIIRFRSKLKSELALVTFANSITLTPGTITVYLSIDGDFKVHAIDRPCAEGLPGEMEERIAQTFNEG